MEHAIRVGHLAILLHKNNNEVDTARQAYYERFQKYEIKHGDLLKFSKEHKDFDAVAKYTAKKWAALQEAKRIAFNTKRRLETACRNLKGEK